MEEGIRVKKSEVKVHTKVYGFSALVTLPHNDDYDEDDDNELLLENLITSTSINKTIAQAQTHTNTH